MPDPAPQLAARPERESWLGPFAHAPFAMVWIANSIALIGIAMYDTASGWLMTTLAPNPFAVSLVHAATNLPMFLFTLPAGAISDIVDPRRLIIAVSCGVATLIAAFAGIVAFDLATPTLLLLTTFLLSGAWALNAPAWLSILPSLVPKTDLPGAAAAQGVAYNVSRTLGPALGGFAMMNFGVSTPFWAFVAGNLAVIAALLWRRTPRRQSHGLRAERLNSAVRTGIRHAANNRLLGATLVRTLAVYPFAAAYWGLLPLIARSIGRGAEPYGLMLSMVSAGAILGSLVQRYGQKRLSPDWMVALGSVVTAFALGLFAFAGDSLLVALAACFSAGVAWVVILTTLYVSAQNVLPDWVRGRGLAVFLTVIFGATTAGSAAWGQIAANVGLTDALLAAAALVLVAIPLSWRWKLDQPDAIDLSPSLHWREPTANEDIEDSRGPVLVKIEYQIEPGDRALFLRAIDHLGEERRRNGAFAWGIFEDMSALGRFEEAYLLENWLELMLLRERVTNEDRALEEEIRRILTAPPKIEFLVAPNRQPLRGFGRAAEAGA